MQASKITTKGQVTIPKRLRKLLGVRPGDRVEFEADSEGKVIVKKIDSHVSLAGILRDQVVREATDKDIEAAIRDNWKKSGRD